MFKGIWRDLGYAGRSLAKARAFTFVCVISLGIGMVPVIAIPYGARIFTMPVRRQNSIAPGFAYSDSNNCREVEVLRSPGQLP
jgi:hypothetical protein